MFNVQAFMWISKNELRSWQNMTCSACYVNQFMVLILEHVLYSIRTDVQPTKKIFFNFISFFFFILNYRLLLKRNAAWVFNNSIDFFFHLLFSLFAFWSFAYGCFFVFLLLRWHEDRTWKLVKQWKSIEKLEKKIAYKMVFSINSTRVCLPIESDQKPITNHYQSNGLTD